MSEGDVGERPARSMYLSTIRVDYGKTQESGGISD